MGDVVHGRTVHSLVKLLGNYNVKYKFACQNKNIGLIDTYLNNNKISYEVFDNIDDVIENVNVIYMTRLQKERMTIEEVCVSNGKLNLDQNKLSRAECDTIIMHPLPRNDELHEDIDTDPRASYFRQMENGLYIRMALIKNLLNK